MSKQEEYDIVIEAGRTEKSYWIDLWRYRELFYILSWRDIKVRYKQTVIGLAWSILRPLMMMLIMSFFYSRITGSSNSAVATDIPYPMIVFTGLLPWMFFASALSESSSSLIGNVNLISKVYFPRLIIPASSVIVTLVDFMISFAILLGLMAWYQFIPSWQIIFLPFFIVMAFLAAFSSGLVLTTLNVKYRDFRYIIPFIVQFGVFISPVMFVTRTIPPQWKWLYSLNPMVGVIEGFRWSILGDAFPIDWQGFAISSAFSLILLAFGIRYFRKMEKTFADVV